MAANLVIVWVFISVTTSGFSGVAWAKTEHESCMVWDKIAQQLTTSTGAQQTCSSNSTDPCTRIDCSGAYEYNAQNVGNLFSLGEKKIEVDYCFGIILNHCDKDISLDFYMQVPAKGVNKTTRVFHNTLLSIPGLSYSISSGTSAQGYLYFEMLRQNNTVTFSVTVKVRVSFAGFNTWPNTLQRRLISNETVPVPPCDPGSAETSSPMPSVGKCIPPHWKDFKPGSGWERRVNVSEDLGKLCKETDYCTRDPWLACDQGTQRCVCLPDFEQVMDNMTHRMGCRPRIRHLMPCRTDEDCSLEMSERCWKGRCHCQEGDVFNDLTQTCEPADRVTQRPAVKPNTAAPPPGSLPTSSKSDNKRGRTEAAVIAGAVIGGLIVLAGILLAAFFAIRRLRRPYHNRELLLEGEDNDGIM